MGAAKVQARIRAKLAWKLAAEMDRVWFAAHPGRDTRIRRATEGEIEFKRTQGVRVPRLLPGVEWFCIVRQNMPGARQRYIVSWHAGAATDDVPEEIAADVWRKLRSPADVIYEAGLRGELTRTGRALN